MHDNAKLSPSCCPVISASVSITNRSGTRTLAATAGKDFKPIQIRSGTAPRCMRYLCIHVWDVGCGMCARGTAVLRWLLAACLPCLPARILIARCSGAFFLLRGRLTQHTTSLTHAASRLVPSRPEFHIRMSCCSTTLGSWCQPERRWKLGVSQSSAG